ncbi:MAG: DUF2497 domain-containing protein [Pseudomonadota bacterium]
MADQAHKEPTMEEILASIRKIISEDDAVPPSAPEPELEVQPEPEPVAVASVEEIALPDDDDMFEEFDLSDLDLEDTPVQADTEPEAEDVLTADAVDAMDDLISDESTMDELTAEFAGAAVADPLDLVEDELIVEDDDIDFETYDTEPVAFPASEPEPEFESVTPTETVPAEEEPMQALTAEATDNAAAGALAKLVAKLDMGSENTLEGMVRELLKPMIKEWLDENLPAIVEDKVELEVQRISRLAR